MHTVLNLILIYISAIYFFFSAGNAAVSEADIRKPNSDMLLMDAAGVPRTNQGKNRSTVINCDQQIN